MIATRGGDFMALSGMETGSNAHDTVRSHLNDTTPASSKSAFGILPDEYRACTEHTNDTEGVKALLRLFGVYEGIEKI